MRDVHISLVVHGDWTAALRCLDTLDAAGRGVDWAATVIDNLPAGDPPAVADSRVSVLANRAPLGFGANHNQVLRPLVADGAARFALVLNDDTELDAGCVTRLVAHLDDHPRTGAAAPAVRGPEGGPRPGRLAWPTVRSAWTYHLTGRTEREDARHGWLQGCALALRLDALRQVGLFDERFHLFFEDVDLSRRLLAAGWELAVCPAAGIMHHEHSTVLRPELVSATVRHGERSRYLYFEKHRGRPTAALMAVGGIVAGRLRPAYAGLRAVPAGDRGPGAAGRNSR